MIYFIYDAVCVSGEAQVDGGRRGIDTGRRTLLTLTKSEYHDVSQSDNATRPRALGRITSPQVVLCWLANECVSKRAPCANECDCKIPTSAYEYSAVPAVRGWSRAPVIIEVLVIKKISYFRLFSHRREGIYQCL